jgi:hypothetical protein
MPSDLVACETVLICLAVTRDAPMKMTRVASEGKGTKSTQSPSKK